MYLKIVMFPKKCKRHLKAEYNKDSQELSTNNLICLIKVFVTSFLNVDKPF